MARIASTVLVVTLLAATVAAFAITQGLKLQKSPIFGTRVVNDVFSPVCACDKDVVRIFFKLRKPDHVDVSIVEGDRVVRTIERGRSYRNGPVTIEWDGRDDQGRVLPEGEYQPRVHLDGERFTTTLPNPIRIDVTPPRVELVSVRPRVISPDGDRRSDRVVVRYRASEPAKGILFVNGRRRELKRFRAEVGTLGWNGKVRGRPVRPGAYTVQAGAEDEAGNRAERTKGVVVGVRYVSLGRSRIAVVAGTRFAIRVSADAARIRWRLGRRSGTARPGTLHLRAPAQSGRFTLVVAVGGHSARAEVFVREPLR